MKIKITHPVHNFLFNRIAVILSISALLLANLAFAPKAFATTLTKTTVMEYNMNAGATSQIAVAFTAGAADTPGSVVLTFNSPWITNSGVIGASANQTVSGATCQAITGATNALATLGVPTSIPASGTITVPWTSTTLTSGQSYCFTLTYASAVTNPTAGVYTVGVAVDGTDTNTVGIDVISNDQIVVSATVSPSFTMTITPGNTDNLGTLSSSVVNTSTGVTDTINTNAITGFFLWAEDNNAELLSPSTTAYISSVATGSNTSLTPDINTLSRYALGIASMSAGTINANYAYNSGTSGGGLSNTTFNQIASDNAAAAGDAVVIHELATITSTQRAASDYSDTITLVGAGSF
jgi:hypothetical protein